MEIEGLGMGMGMGMGVGSVRVVGDRLLVEWYSGRLLTVVHVLLQ